VNESEDVARWIGLGLEFLREAGQEVQAPVVAALAVGERPNGQDNTGRVIRGVPFCDSE
jgi:hypothetical protein